MRMKRKLYVKCHCPSLLFIVNRYICLQKLDYSLVHLFLTEVIVLS